MFKPINKINSVEEVVFICRLSNRSLFDKYESYSQAEVLERFDGTAFSVQTVQVGSEEDLNKIVVIEFGAPEDLQWGIKIQPNYVSVFCFDYTRWNIVLDRAIDLIRKIFADFELIKIDGIQFIITDAFVEKAGEKDEQLSTIFKDSSPYLSQKYIESKGMLSFEQHTVTDPIEDNLGFGIEGLNIKREPIFEEQTSNGESLIVGERIEIKYEKTFALIDDKSASLYTPTIFAESQLAVRLLDQAHSENKVMLQSILRNDTLADIGLSEEGNAND